MYKNRRQFILGAGALAAAPMLYAATTVRHRVVILGAGWGGLAAARQLRQLAPEIEVVVIERGASFVSSPITNRWLVGLDDGRRLYRPLAPVAAANGYRLRREEITAIDRANRQVLTSGSPLAYDWLLLSPGIREDWGGLCDGDAMAGRALEKAYFSGFVGNADFEQLKHRVNAFSGRNFLMNVPPAPYRCPPAPYERAVMLAWLFKSRGIRAKLTLIDPNAPWPGYQRIFREYFGEQINYLPQTALLRVDQARRTASLEFEDIEFDDAILMPPQQAGDICWQAGLIQHNDSGQPVGWADVDPATFHSRADPQVFVIGDSIGRVSPLFGYYPKTGQIAARMGRIAATGIVALSRGESWLPELPQSTCYAQLNVDPPEVVEIATHYTRRGDGALVQNITQTRNNQPAGEADRWLDGMHGELFGAF